MNPVLLRRRQLVLREAGRFPDIARKYYDSGPRRTISALSAAFARLAHRGELAMDDPQRAATQFAFLVVGEPLDTAMFRGAGRGRRRRELDALAEAGVEVFLAAYGSRAKPSGSVVPGTRTASLGSALLRRREQHRPTD
jgi:TetR/AcrR family transcriptional repressor of mexJK operon